MSINPQFTYDNQGNPLGVFLSMEDWKSISQKVDFDVPEWEKRMIEARLAEYYANPEATVDGEEFFQDLLKADNE